MSKGNPHPKPPPPPPLGSHRARKGEVNLVAYNVRIDPATIALIKELQALLGVRSQGEVITKAIKMLRSQYETNGN